VPGLLVGLLAGCSPEPGAPSDPAASENLARPDIAAAHPEDAAAATATAAVAPGDAAWFTPAGPESGLTHRNLSGPTAQQGKRYLLDCVGPGIAVLDADLDGRLDLFLPQGRDDARTLEEGGAASGGDCADRLYLNRGGRRFEEAGESLGLADRGYGFGALAFDQDGDGDSDLLLANFGLNRLYRNDGGAFIDATAAHPGLEGAPRDWSTGAAAGDVDEDGDLDVYVCNYVRHDSAELDARGPCRFMTECKVPCGPLGLDPQADRFYLNDGPAGFRLREATAEAGLSLPASYGFQPLFLDVEPDGDLDLYVTNDSQPNWLFVNDGSGRFTEQGLVAGVACSVAGLPEAGMGAAAGDLTGDARPELYVTNFSSQVNALYVNQTGADGAPWFDEQAQRAGAGAPTFFRLGWGCALQDFDDDGWTDVFSSNGHIYPQVDDCPPPEVVHLQECNLFRRVPGARLLFEDLGARAGPVAGVRRPHRSSVAADLDDDGALDLLVTRLDEPPLLLWNSLPARGHWLSLRVEHAGTPARLAVGARVVASAGGRTFSGEVRAGSSFLSTEDPRVHLGLGDHARLERLEVEWPGGVRRAWTDVAADRHLVLRPDLEQPLPAGETAR
jgi:hypothetical protein